MKNHSQESSRAEKLVEAKATQTTETANEVSVDNSTTTHPDIFTFVCNKGQIK